MKHIPTTMPRKRGRQLARVGGSAAALTLLGLGAFAFLPLSTRGLEPHPAPAKDYDDAMAKVARLQALDGPHVNQLCRSYLLTHGHAVDTAVILVHGITNCPYQFLQFGTLLHEQGCNVLIPRMPRNGLADRATGDLKNLRASELRDYGDTMVDIASGLGRRVVLVGLSAGGVVAMWAAQFRREVDRAVLIAPALGIGTSQGVMQWMMMNLFVRLPNIYTNVKPEEIPLRPEYTYLHNSTHGLGEMLRLGVCAWRDARRRQPAAREITMVLNADDTVVYNEFSRRVLEHWRATGAQNLSLYEFEAHHHLGHDLIDPRQPNQKVDLVYPILRDIILNQQQGVSL